MLLGKKRRAALSCFAQALHCTGPSVFTRRENPAPHQTGSLRKAGRWIAAQELFNTPRVLSVLSLH